MASCLCVNVDVKLLYLFLQISRASEELIKYKKLMNALAWFFFRLLVFEYIEDSTTGMSFRLPGGQQWKIFIEVLVKLAIACFIYTSSIMCVIYYGCEQYYRI